MEDTRNIKGLSELQKFLDQLAPKVERNIMRGALRAGGNVILKLAKSNVHNVSGELADSLRISTTAKGGTVVARIKAGGGKTDIANRPFWVEFGTRPHLISVQESEKPINARLSARAGHLVRASMTTINRVALKIGNKFVGPTVKHPGAKPRPFMRPALDAGASAAVVAAAEYIKSRLTQQGLDASGVEIK